MKKNFASTVESKQLYTARNFNWFTHWQETGLYQCCLADAIQQTSA